jgi:hypothetical protein
MSMPYPLVVPNTIQRDDAHQHRLDAALHSTRSLRERSARQLQVTSELSSDIPRRYQDLQSKRACLLAKVSEIDEEMERLSLRYDIQVEHTRVDLAFQDAEMDRLFGEIDHRMDEEVLVDSARRAKKVEMQDLLDVACDENTEMQRRISLTKPLQSHPSELVL